MPIKIVPKKAGPRGYTSKAFARAKKKAGGSAAYASRGKKATKK